MENYIPAESHYGEYWKYLKNFTKKNLIFSQNLPEFEDEIEALNTAIK